MKKDAIFVERVLSKTLFLAFFCHLVIMVAGCSRIQTVDDAAPQPEQAGTEAQAEPDQPRASVDEQQPATSTTEYEYSIEIGDTFDVKVYNNNELNESLVVRPDGKISLLLAEEIQAAGLTPAELDRVITEIYSRRLHNPEIAVIMRKFAANRVYVGGEVTFPQEVQIDGRLTILQAIYKAGGFKESAKLKSVILLQDQQASEPVVTLVNLEEILETGRGDILLRPYDAVFVPKTFIARADKFVDQYINRIVPRNLTAGFSWTYNLTPWIEVFNQ